jgi:A/G-specific adenine glycosylase
VKAVLDRECFVPARFRALIYRYYDQEGRSFPWRRTRDPYRILVSEFMLQQTQVERVLTKYEIFLQTFPDFPTLAAATLAEVLTLWQGLGYNRRAKALRETARLVMGEGGGILPEDPVRLERFPGVGGATAGAVAAFAFGRPAVFLETNIRRVFIHFFFPPSETVRDRDILPLAALTLDRRDPRRWYYALMDYGVMLKRAVANPNRRSAHYQRQSPFEGSDRQVRSGVLKALLAEPGLRSDEVMDRVGVERERGRRIIGELTREGFLEARGGKLRIA